jgi:hypothetical protein
LADAFWETSGSGQFNCNFKKIGSSPISVLPQRWTFPSRPREETRLRDRLTLRLGRKLLKSHSRPERPTNLPSVLGFNRDCELGRSGRAQLRNERGTYGSVAALVASRPANLPSALTTATDWDSCCRRGGVFRRKAKNVSRDARLKGYRGLPRRGGETSRSSMRYKSRAIFAVPGRTNFANLSANAG